MCCAYSGVMLAFKVYTGRKEDAPKESTVDLCENLCADADLLKARGRILYTDNYYTSVALAKRFFEKYGWTITGTFVPTDKKLRSGEDFPFLKLSNGARDSVGRGWFREAVIQLKAPSGTKYYIQATTWRDKKQVCFLSTSSIGFSNGVSVRRHTRGKREREIIDGVRVQAEYVKWFNAVDRNDRDSADYSTSIRTNRYYIRIFCWALDRAVHCLYCVVVDLVKDNIGDPKWKRYAKNGGRREFQIDLAIDLINYGLALDWDGGKERPSYMRQSVPFVPCDCKKCLFCKHGHTGKIAGVDRKTKKAVFHYQCGGRMVTEGCTDKRVNLMGKSGGYCRMCYRNGDPSLTSAQKRKLCKSSALGCQQCREPICSSCWGQGYDRHQNN